MSKASRLPRQFTALRRLATTSTVSGLTFTAGQYLRLPLRGTGTSPVVATSGHFMAPTIAGP